ncbi:MAG: cysteine-rich CWC family protein [Chloracidobacterium sp.]|nr:cysteine-rich CWC family protein [Chloracidobacterium sp.]
MRFRKLLGLVSPRYRSPSVCESCGGEFVCGAAVTGCWCTEIKLKPEARAELRGRFKKCLCRKCLEKLSAASQV